MHLHFGFDLIDNLIEYLYEVINDDINIEYNYERNNDDTDIVVNFDIDVNDIKSVNLIENKLIETNKFLVKITELDWKFILDN